MYPGESSPKRKRIGMVISNGEGSGSTWAEMIRYQDRGRWLLVLSDRASSATSASVEAKTGADQEM